MSQQQAFTHATRTILPALSASSATSASTLVPPDELGENNSTRTVGAHLQSASSVPSLFSQSTSFRASQIPLGTSIPSLSGSASTIGGDTGNRNVHNRSVAAVPEIRDDAYLKVGRSLSRSENKKFSGSIKRDRYKRGILEEYKCSICLDTIVCAAVLDCESGGGHSFCSECVETLMKSQQQQRILHELDGSLLSSSSSRGCHKCPNCGDSFTKAVPCRALDAAILDAVDRSRELDETDKEEFYARLVLWREFVKRRNRREEEEHRRNSGGDFVSRVGEYLGSFKIATVAGAAALSVLILAMSLVKRN
mmetsp:Transcript_4816/g.7002  ORF Transcript_4816/g.7002 Transcript_4816/m.7002 type:complete len:308 (-) Transcript_4816:55-978(-)